MDSTQTTNTNELEEKWSKNWFENNLYKATDFDSKPKKYILAEFPYPSGASLHAGHMMRYTAPDVYSRFLRMQGFNVLFPMGWDAFGLPAENYAVKTGVHPAVTTKKAIQTMKASMQRMGYSFDWDREFSTTDPEYYKWTQWLFLKFWENGLAELKEMPIWWCDKLKTVLAEEEVITDKSGNKFSERGNYPVVRKNLRQWVLKIPEYAEKLISGLETVDYPTSIKNAQINWIGKSTGAEVDFAIENSTDKLRVFTTRLDTIFGAAFVCISPEHPLAKKLLTENALEQGNKYIEAAKNKGDLERTDLQKDKTGVFTGTYAINPFSNSKLPVWLADFVVMSYGTGAIMGVPAHDKRDFEFAKKFDLPIKPVVFPAKEAETKANELYTDYGILNDSGTFSGMKSEQAISEMLEVLKAKNIGLEKTNFKIRDWVFSRQRYWGEPIPLVFVEPDNHVEPETNLPLTLPNIPDYEPTEDALSPLAKNKAWVNITTKSGEKAMRETNTMPNWAGSCWYFIRYTDPHNNNQFADMAKMKYWLPVDKYFGGAEHTTLHLLYSRFWYKFFYDLGLVPTAEPYNWRLNGGMLLAPDGSKMSKSGSNGVDPMELANTWGADALRMYICFLGPYEDTYPWLENGIKACSRFINNLQDIANSDLPETSETQVLKSFHKLIKTITAMYGELKMNTSVSEFMKFANEAKKLGGIGKDIWPDYLKLLAPIIPFITEELWQKFYSFKEWQPENSIHLQKWPEFSAELANVALINLAVQVDGKVRGVLEVAPDADEETVKTMAFANASVSKHLEGKSIQKFIFVRGKILSIITTK